LNNRFGQSESEKMKTTHKKMCSQCLAGRFIMTRFFFNQQLSDVVEFFGGDESLWSFFFRFKPQEKYCLYTPKNYLFGQEKLCGGT
jgi:hypothetical protein